MKKLLKRITIGVLTGALMFGALGTDFGTMNVKAAWNPYIKEIPEGCELVQYDASLSKKQFKAFCKKHNIHFRAGFKSKDPKLNDEGTYESLQYDYDMSVFHFDSDRKRGKNGLPKNGYKTKEPKKLVGKKLWKHNVRYKVINKKSVTVVQAIGIAQNKTITIPERVKIYGHYYNVVGFEKKAFIDPKIYTENEYYNDEDGLTDYDKPVYWDLCQAKTIKIKSTKLQKKYMNANTFKDARKVTIKVPKKNKTKYTTWFKKSGMKSNIKIKAL